MKPYAELPAYLADWDAALMPFALNEATRFISPTKTPEYLAAGVPVVSTPITDVVRDWARDGLVEIASDADGFVRAAEAVFDRARVALAGPRGRPAALDVVGRHLGAHGAADRGPRQGARSPPRRKTLSMRNRRRGAVWGGAREQRCLDRSEAGKPA